MGVNYKQKYVAFLAFFQQHDFDTIPVNDGRTDGHPATDSIVHAMHSIAQ